jgi:KEOPS complex subunit Cgi121
LIKKLEDFDRYLATAGFRNVKIKDINNFFGIVRRKAGDAHVQFFDTKLIAGWEHLYFAALNALNAFKNKTNISKGVAVETLLYASAQRQIEKAVELLGIKPDSSQAAVFIVAETKQRAASTLKVVSRLMMGERDDSVLELTNGKVKGIKELFGISDLEMEAKLEKEGFEKEALIDLVIEHMALLATQR